MIASIKIIDVTKDVVSNDEGNKLYKIMADNLNKGNAIELSLMECPPISSSFLNSSFGELVFKFGIDVIKNKIKLVHYKPSYAKRIKDYLEFTALQTC